MIVISLIYGEGSRVDAPSPRSRGEVGEGLGALGLNEPIKRKTYQSIPGQMDLVIGFFARNPNDDDGPHRSRLWGGKSARRIDARRYNTTGTVSPQNSPSF